MSEVTEPASTSVTTQVGLDSVTMDNNSRGATWSLKFYKREGETDEQLLDRVAKLNAKYVALYRPL